MADEERPDQWEPNALTMAAYAMVAGAVTVGVVSAFASGWTAILSAIAVSVALGCVMDPALKWIGWWFRG